MPQASGWAMLGDALGGDSEKSYQEGLALGARTQDALTQARERVSKAQAQANLAAQLEASGIDPNIARASATALTAGAGLGDVITMLGRDQERRFRDIAGSADPNVDTGARQRALAGVASGPIRPFEAVGSRGYADIMHPELGVQKMPAGAIDWSSASTPIQVLHAYRMLDEAGQVPLGQEKRAFDVMRPTQRIIDMGGVPGVIDANPFSGSQFGLGDALAPPTGTAPPVAPAGPAPATAAPPAAARPAPVGAGGRGVTPLASAGTVAANVGAIAAGKKTGELRAEANVSLPESLNELDYMQKGIDQLLAAPGFDTIYGHIVGTPLGTKIAKFGSQEAATAAGFRNQLQAQTFGVSIQKNRGLGQLSNAEGQKFTDAFTVATNPEIDPATARQAWARTQHYLGQIKARLQIKAGHAPSVPIEFETEADAEGVDLPPGTRVLIGGRAATVQ